MQKQFGLIGKDIQYSFSKRYFTEKFDSLGLEDHSYENFDIADIDAFVQIIRDNPELKGLNVTIPYKEAIIPFLDKLSAEAALIGAVNTIRFTKDGKLKGYNTDYYGFKKSIAPLLKPNHKKALILGNGGAAKAVAFALDELGIAHAFVSRIPSIETLDYHSIDHNIFSDFQIVINCTPIGTSPDTEMSPEIPYQYFTSGHIAFDLIYNPEITLFLKKAKEHGAVVKNGYEMLVYQAEKAWEIWNEQRW